MPLNTLAAVGGSTKLDSLSDPVLLQRTDPWRYSGRMGMHVRQHWRKSSQWVALRRNHAQRIVDDTNFYPKFERHCHNAWDSDYGRSAAHSWVLERKSSHAPFHRLQTPLDTG